MAGILPGSGQVDQNNTNTAIVQGERGHNHEHAASSFFFFLFVIFMVALLSGACVTAPTRRKKRKQQQQQNTQTPLRPMFLSSAANSNTSRYSAASRESQLKRERERSGTTNWFNRQPGWHSEPELRNQPPQQGGQTQLPSVSLDPRPSMIPPKPTVLPGRKANGTWEEAPPSYDARWGDRSVPEMAGPPVYQEGCQPGEVPERERMVASGLQERRVEMAGRNMP